MGNLNHDKKTKGAEYACITIVNCFHISNFVLWQTAEGRNSTAQVLL